ncbi:DUF433 domain-containing protein [Micromonospora sp. NBC_01813]|uniref:DUF433 domain-containing protein n=1 Tax=Micromonospora sp. NBC_01813 TaxID=2975988 RepID=UPI002DDB2738|nr:DUF433 domain-containing protein [Micromonospora sp. NBC_01813]WSA07230.1 DUF433 domain-containing protein [Micromonospora sp. NBC_01813]
MNFERITVNPAQMGGAPCIRGLRIPVATVVAMVADGMSPDEIVLELPDLAVDDVWEALRFAAEAVRERELPLHRAA